MFIHPPLQMAGLVLAAAPFSIVMGAIIASRNGSDERGNLGEFTKAIADFDSAISINPAYARAYNNRSSARATLCAIQAQARYAEVPRTQRRGDMTAHLTRALIPVSSNRLNGNATDGMTSLAPHISASMFGLFN